MTSDFDLGLVGLVDLGIGLIRQVMGGPRAAQVGLASPYILGCAGPVLGAYTGLEDGLASRVILNDTRELPCS